jgi:hypothetical protein
VAQAPTQAAHQIVHSWFSRKFATGWCVRCTASRRVGWWWAACTRACVRARLPPHTDGLHTPRACCPPPPRAGLPMPAAPSCCRSWLLCMSRITSSYSSTTSSR